MAAMTTRRRPSKKKSNSRNKGSSTPPRHDVNVHAHSQITTTSYYTYDAANICAAVGFLLYVNCIWACGFCYDDIKAIQRNPDVLNTQGDGIMSRWRDIWWNDFWGVHVDNVQSNKSYRPMVVVSFRLNALISREPWIFHFGNALLYAVSCWLVVRLMLSVESTVVLNPKRRSTAILLSGLWFASHPIHTESVASLVGRAEILAAICCLLGGRLFMKGKYERNTPYAVVAAPMLFLFTSACLCKETAVVMPVVLAATDTGADAFSPGKKTRRFHYRVLARAVGLSMVSVGYLYFRYELFKDNPEGQTLENVSLKDNFLQHLTAMDKLRTAIYIQAKYVQLLLFPWNLSCDYSLGVINPVQAWASSEMAFAGMVVVGIVAWAWYAVSRVFRVGDANPILALGWTFGPLIPACHIVGIGTVMAERMLFLPSIGAAMLLCHVLHRVPLPSKPTIQTMVAGCVVLFAYKTLKRNPDWANTARLHSANLENHPKSLKLLLSVAGDLEQPDQKAFSCAKAAQELLDEYSPILREAPYSYALARMADIKTRTETWPEGANLNEALLYANEAVAMGNRFGEDAWSFLHDRKGTALLKLAAPTRDGSLLNEAAAAFEVAVAYDSTQRGHLYCMLATTRMVQEEKIEAYKQFQTCFQLEGTGEAETWMQRLVDYRNYAVLMKGLSGVDSNNATAAQVYGKPAVDAITKLLALADEEADEKKLLESQMDFWIKVKHDILKLMYY